MRRRMAERRRRRAKASEQSEREKKNEAGELPHLDAKLRGCDVVEKAKRNGNAAKLREASTMAAARARFLRRRRLRFDGVQGGGLGVLI